MGGMLNPFTPLTAHIHHFYFRIDLDIDGFQSDVCEEFNRNSLNDPGGDEWILLNSQSKRIAKSDAARKWRIRDLVSTNEAGQPRAYDIEIPQLAGRDNYSTGDVWVTIYRGDSIQQGADVAPIAQIVLLKQSTLLDRWILQMEAISCFGLSCVLTMCHAIKVKSNIICHTIMGSSQ
jgi:hypothetical protein